MAFDLSSLFLIFFAIMVLQPLFTGRWYALRRAQAIRAIERSHGSRVITMIHRQEKRSIFGFAVSRHIDLEGAQMIIAAIKDTPDDMPIDLVLHTPGGLVLAAMQIARAVEAHKAKVTVYVPVYAMSGGTLIALAANEIVLGEFSVLGPIDPQSLDSRLRVLSKPATRSLSRVSSTSQWFSPIWGRRLSPRLSEGR
jgi:ClpP class serine protease